jgi:hypothetical protein
MAPVGQSDGPPREGAAWSVLMLADLALVIDAGQYFRLLSPLGVGIEAGYAPWRRSAAASGV